MSLNPLPVPADLNGRRLTIIQLNDPLFRTHGIRRNPLVPGRSGLNRFDAPDGSYEVLYLGRDPFCAFIETFAHAAGTRAVTTTALKERALSQIKPRSSPLRLIDLAESGCLVRIGADARLFATEYDVSQMWSKALHDHPIAAHGLLYPSRLDLSKHAIALFLDRAPELVELSRESWYAPGKQRLLLTEIIDHYELELIETKFIVSRKPIARQDRLSGI